MDFAKIILFDSVDRYHYEILSFELALDILQSGQFIKTWGAPSGPIVHQYPFASKIRQSHFFTVKIQQLEIDGVVRTRVGQGTFVELAGRHLDPAQRDGAVDELIDRLLVEAGTLGVPLDELGQRLARRIERVRNEEKENLQ